MNLHSLGYRTDLIFAAFDGIIAERADYLVVRTPSNPTFYWGNFVLFARPPQAGDELRWPEVFAREIGAPPQVEHQTFGWDAAAGELGAVQPFLDAGFRLNHAVVLAAAQVHPPARMAADVVVRPLRSDADWAQALENQILCRAPEFDEPSYRVFKERKRTRYQAMHAADLGDWFGAFRGDQLVADLGIFHKDGLARFQTVQTHPDFRRQGIAGALVYESARYAFEHYHLEQLVIVAELGSAAARLYRSIGFEPVEYQFGLEKWPGMA